MMADYIISNGVVWCTANSAIKTPTCGLSVLSLPTVSQTFIANLFLRWISGRPVAGICL